jgi:hypothetical protein
MTTKAHAQLDPFEAADAEIKAWGGVESAASPEHARPPHSPFMTDSAAYELQRSIKALGIVLMRTERTISTLGAHVTKLTTAVVDLATVMKARAAIPTRSRG